MKAIVAVDDNWGIGYHGNLLQHIPEDMKFFREKTTNKIVVMGRKTFESLPGKKPLKDRINVILTSDKNYKVDGAVICHSINELLTMYSNNLDNIFVIGGEYVYDELLLHCSEVYVTKMDKSYIADKYFPNLDRDDRWAIKSASETKVYNDIDYRFYIYERKWLDK